MLAAFPLAGALLGAVLGLLWRLFAGTFNPQMSAALVVAAWVLLTRGFHLDGLADCADGIGGSYTREGRLKIMKDPHIGAFGTIAIVCALLMKFAVLSSFALTVPHSPFAWWSDNTNSWSECMLFTALILSSARLGILVGACGAHYARDPESGLGRDFIAGARPWTLLGGAIVPLAMGAVWAGANGFIVVLAPVLTALFLRRLFQNKLGGQTGDTLGATVELGEIAAILAAVAIL